MPEPEGGRGEVELAALCDAVVEGRANLSYMEVARAMCLRCEIREGREAARKLAVHLEVSGQTFWNWLDRDAAQEWASKMRSKLAVAVMGQALGYAPRGRRISEHDLRMIAGLMRSLAKRPTSRALRERVRSRAMSVEGWGHLKQISHSYLHRKRHVLNQMVAEAERTEYYARRAEAASSASSPGAAPSTVSNALPPPIPHSGNRPLENGSRCEPL